MTSKLILATAALAALSACETGLSGVSSNAQATGIERRIQEERPTEPAGTCWSEEQGSTATKTVTEQVLVAPAKRGADGQVLTPPIYRNETRQIRVETEPKVWFETVCSDILTPDFIETLQRALAARGLYGGPISGEIDVGTQSAIKSYQTSLGLSDARLSVATAQTLGLVAYPEPESG